MATYYTSDDLTYRRNALVSFLSAQSSRVTNHFFYGQPMTKCCLTQLEYVTAMMEVISCYEPITLAAEDGETNCLTEADLDAAFDTISELTGLCFKPKGSTYIDNTPDEETNTTLTLNTLATVTTNGQQGIKLNTFA